MEDFLLSRYSKGNFLCKREPVLRETSVLLSDSGIVHRNAQSV